jgi:hypothetical protein
MILRIHGSRRAELHVLDMLVNPMQKALEMDVERQGAWFVDQAESGTEFQDQNTSALMVRIARAFHFD